MSAMTSSTGTPAKALAATLYPILFMISLTHLFNDSLQAVIPAVLPILQKSMALNYTQLGFIGFGLNLTSSVMQPVVGLYSDKRPSPYFLPLGMFAMCLGMLTLGFAPSYPFVLLATVLIGVGSAIFHPEAARVSYMAAGARRGLAQSIYQVGGNAGQALAPIMTALIFVPLGQIGAVWFCAVTLCGIGVQLFIARWYRDHLAAHGPVKKKAGTSGKSARSGVRSKIIAAMVMIVFFVFARSWYQAIITNYYQFFLTHYHGLTIARAQIFIFLFLGAGAVGTFFGGPLADRFGRRNIMLFSMLGAAPLALLLPYAGMGWNYVLLPGLGFIILSSFSVMVVYAQELMPSNVGVSSGLIIGLAFGMGAIGSAALGHLIDAWGLVSVIHITSYLPLLGLIAFFLPSDRTVDEWTAG